MNISVPDKRAPIRMAEQAFLLKGFLQGYDAALITALKDITTKSVFRHMITPGGYEMSVAMTNCGARGWVTDRRGYRYDALDPLSNAPWPAMPALFKQLAEAAARQAGFPHFTPDACLINRYAPGAKLSLHQDRDEQDFSQPIVSFSLGLPATFDFGGPGRKSPVTPWLLEHGDVVVWGAESRLFYHGIRPLKKGSHSLTGNCRINLTFRRAY